MHIEWSRDLSVGVEEIDNQHKSMITNINKFFDALDRGEGREELIRLFRFLADYVKLHFSLEENYMTKYCSTGHIYGDETIHKAEHQAFMRDFSAFQDELENADAAPLLTTEFKDWIRNWLEIHLVKMDSGLGAYLNEVFPFMKGTRSQG
jgi:hemerythrin